MVTHSAKSPSALLLNLLLKNLVLKEKKFPELSFVLASPRESVSTIENLYSVPGVKLVSVNL